MAGPADSVITDAIRNGLFKRLAVPSARALDLVEQAMDLHPQSDSFRAELAHGDEAGAIFTGAPLIAVTAFNPLTDADDDFIVYGSLLNDTPGAGTNRLNFYATQARGGAIVATADVADGAVAAITPNAGYAFAATMKVAAAAGNFDFALRISPPFYLQVDRDFDGTEQDDAQNVAAMQSAAATAKTSLEAAAAAMATAAAAVMLSTFRRRFTSRSSETVLIAPNADVTDGGQVTQAPVGLLEDLVQWMADNTGGSGEMKAGAGTFGAPATALATGTTVLFTTITLGRRAVPGVLTLRWTKGLDDTDPEAEVTFDAVDTRRKPNDGQATVVLPFPLRLGATWACPEYGIDVLLVDYSPNVANTSGTSLSVTAADWVRPVGLTSELSNAGVLYTYYDIGLTRLEFYKTEAGRNAQDPGQLVTYATLAAAAVNTGFATQDVGNGLIITGETGAGTGALLVEGDKGTVDFRPPTVDPRTSATATITDSVRRSAWLRLLSDGFVGGAPGTPTQTAQGWELNTGAAPNISDAWVRARSLTQGKRVSNRR